MGLRDYLTVTRNVRALRDAVDTKIHVYELAEVKVMLDPVHNRLDVMRRRATFMGIPIIESAWVPNGCAVVTVNGEIIKIVRLEQTSG